MNWIGNKKKLCVVGCMVVYIGIGFFWGISIYKGNLENFFIINISDFITAYGGIGSLLAILLISYYLVEEKADNRIIKEKINEKLDSIINDVYKLNEDFFHDAFNSCEFTMLKKRIDRNIDLITHYSKNFNYNQEANNILNNFDDIQTTISNHITNPHMIREIIPDIKPKIDSIDSNCESIFKKIF